MVRLPLSPALTLTLTRHKHKEQKRWTEWPEHWAAALAGVTRDAIYI
jgi:hypothetical protein